MKINFDNMILIEISGAWQGLSQDKANKVTNWCDLVWFDKDSKKVVVTRHHTIGFDMRNEGER